jgi:hypothetical protein
LNDLHTTNCQCLTWNNTAKRNPENAKDESRWWTTVPNVDSHHHFKCLENLAKWPHKCPIDPH